MENTDENKLEEGMSQQTDGVNPPELPADAAEGAKPDVESAWAEALGINYDAEAVAKAREENMQQAPPPLPPGSPAPQVMPEQIHEPMPPTYMIWAILSTICCCLPAGVVAIVFAAQVSSRYFARDLEGAKRASRNAEIWIIVSIVAGIVFNALYAPFSLLLPS